MTFTNINTNQGTQQFDELVDALNQVSQDRIAKGQGDPSFDTSIAANAMLRRQQQNGIDSRSAWLMTTVEWISGRPPKGLLWGANPSDISWEIPQRTTQTKNMFGTVLHVWPDNFRQTFFDEMRLSFTLQSGNLMPVFIGDDAGIGVGPSDPTNQWLPSAGVANFYDFLQLVDAPKLTVDGRVNYVSIQYSSNLFPSLTLLGFFDGPVRFQDTASNPNQVNSWSADFIVYDTVPRLTSNDGRSSNVALLDRWLTQRVRAAKMFQNTSSR